MQGTSYVHMLEAWLRIKISEIKESPEKAVKIESALSQLKASLSTQCGLAYENRTGALIAACVSTGTFADETIFARQCLGVQIPLSACEPLTRISATSAESYSVSR